ncbi:MAG: ferritin family protein [Candidatus Omnitrophica bacterium]|nr:ferritin family protein [Candidatus Omnitrophota bacterium]
MNILKLPEVFDVGIEKEKKRRDFYEQVARQFAGEGEVKELFSRLRDWEETHIQKFTELRKSSKGHETTESYPGELADYTDALLDDTLYREVAPDAFGSNVKTPLDAVQYGIGFEKDAILFFRELLPYIEPNAKKAIEQLISEEKQHIVFLTQLKKSIGG